MEPAADGGRPERCPECRHSWQDGEVVHFPDCRYFFLNDEDEEYGETSRGNPERSLPGRQKRVRELQKKSVMINNQ